MPRIKITENEDLSLSQLSVIENVVLVPLFVKEYPVDEEGTVLKEPLKFTSYSKFKGTFIDCGVVGYDEDDKPIYDKSYYYIMELLGMGLNVVVDCIIPEETSEGASEWDSEGNSEADYEALFEEEINKRVNEGEFDKFVDRNLYNIKFITTGAYANWGEGNTDDWCFKRLAQVAFERGDAVALIELVDIDLRNEEFLRNVADKTHPEYIDISMPVTELNPRFDEKPIAVLGKVFENAACFYPHGVYRLNFSGLIGEEIKKEMPASFGFLMCFAYSIQVNEDWLAAAGVTRGYAPNLVALNYPVGDSFMHILQGDEYGWVDSSVPKFYPVRINPLMFKGTYGDRMWGNRTFSWYHDGLENNALLAMNKSYREYLNVRVLICDIKKQMYGAAVRVTFEPNDDITWLNFKGLINNLLDRMQNSRGLDWYAWQREYTDKKATIAATLWIKPIEAVENFDLNIQLTDQDTIVVEGNTI